MATNGFSQIAGFIWDVADLLRGPYHPNQYKDVMLPLTVLRRLDCVLAPTKEQVLSEYKQWKDKGRGLLEAKLTRITKVPFSNISKYSFQKLLGEPANIAANLVNFIKGFSENARNIIEHFDFDQHIEKLDKSDRLFKAVSKFAELNLHPDVVSNYQMGNIFEELIRKFNELSNEEAGDHFTPREIIRLMVDLLLTPDGAILTRRGIVRTLLDPAAGTGGMLSVAEEYLRELNPDAQLEVFGQDINDQSYAICGSDLLIKGQAIEHIVCGDSFTADGFKGMTFDYLLANPPFGVKWESAQETIQKEAEELGDRGRFGAGLPRINDGSFLFLQHMISKMKKPKDGGTRLAIVFNGSPLFTGAAGSGESDIRKWIIENDWLDAIVALPDQLFYNTGISTYLWIVTNRKEEKRKGRVQLIDATSYFSKMRKSLGNKRNEITEQHKNQIVQLYGSFKQGEKVRIFRNEEFGYNRITVERPLKLNFCVNEDRLTKLKETSQFQSLAKSKKLKKEKNISIISKEEQEGQKVQEKILSALKSLHNGQLIMNQKAFEKKLEKTLSDHSLDLKTPLYKAILDSLSERDETADTVVDSKGNPLPDAELRDNENVPLGEKVEEYVKREVLPYVPDVWVDEEKTKVGYEISFNRYFYVYQPPRPVEQIEKDLVKIEEEIADLLRGSR